MRDIEPDAEIAQIDPEDLKDHALRVVRRVPPNERREWLESLPPLPGGTDDEREAFFDAILRRVGEPDY
jgi:hypothetical protein